MKRRSLTIALSFALLCTNLSGCGGSEPSSEQTVTSNLDIPQTDSTSSVE